MDAINLAIAGVQEARLQWATNDAVYAKLGEVLRHLRIAEKKAQKALDRLVTMAQDCRS